MRVVGSIVVAAMILGAPPTACALCIYKGKDNAKTTIEEEFRDSTWVVRAKVLAAKDHWSDVEDSWTLYRIEVFHSYKGQPPKVLRFFTYRNSGGFYMDRPWVPLPAGHDIGGEYLLFLDSIPAGLTPPPTARGAVMVNYPCGVSGSWAEVPAMSRKLLGDLERAR